MARDSKKQPRVRRSPEAARALILDAAKQVLADKGPAQTQLKTVAQAAGVSHSLITHYFGTVDALVEEVLHQHMSELRGAILSGIQESPGEPDAVLDLVFSALSDPMQGRLMAWTLLSGRSESDEFFARKNIGLRQITDMLVSTGKSSKSARAEIENRLVLIWCAIVGYSVAGPILWDSLGVKHTPKRDKQFRDLVSGFRP